MSHADTILELPKGFELLATTESIPIAAFKRTALTTFLSMVYSFTRKYITPLKERKYCIISW